MVWAIPTGWLWVTLVGTGTSKREQQIVASSSYPFGPRHAIEKPEPAVIYGPFWQGHSALASCNPG